MVMKLRTFLPHYISPGIKNFIESHDKFCNYMIVLIVCDCMVYPDPKFLICKTKKWPHFFLRLEPDFFDPMLSRKTFATNPL